MATVLSGTSGALYYKPAGTKGTFGTANVVIGTETTWSCVELVVPSVSPKPVIQDISPASWTPKSTC